MRKIDEGLFLNYRTNRFNDDGIKIEVGFFPNTMNWILDQLKKTLEEAEINGETNFYENGVLHALLAIPQTHVAGHEQMFAIDDRWYDFNCGTLVARGNHGQEYCDYTGEGV